MKKHFIYERIVKRIIDIIVSGLFLIVFSWLYLILYFVVKTKLGSPVLFKQDRPGYKGKIFKMFKYRSMTDERDENGELLPDEVRLTAFGKKLRSTSLDELPEMLNVFKGDMSLIGPRPLLVSYLPLYNERQSYRHDVRPGITGYAQAYGRNSISWEEKFEKDVYYVENCSFLLDLKIIFHTIKVVITHEGVSSATSATMEAFTGTKEDKD